MLSETMTDGPALTRLAADRHGRVAFLALLAGAVGIAFAPIFVRLSEVGPVATAFWRLALALPLLALWLAAQERPRRPARRPSSVRDAARLALAGVFFAGDLAFWHWSIRFTSVANATLLANLAPLFVTLAGWALFGERFSRLFLAGLAIAMAGAGVLMGTSVTIGPETLLGDALGVVTAIFYASYILAIGRLRADFSTATIMTWSGLATAVVLLAVAWLSGESLLVDSAHGWAVLVGLAWISHAGGQSLIAFALASLPAALSSVSLLLQPVTAALLAWVLLAEPLGPVQALGGAIVLAGVLIARRGSLTPSR